MSDSSKGTRLSYIPATDEDRQAMLRAIGVPDVEAIFEQIPEQVRLGRALRLPDGLAEQEVLSLLESTASRSRNLGDLVCFLGAGAYDHYIPSVVDAVVSRSEFYTAYTPYQAEASQGLLQSIYEYQSLIADLTGMDVSNASLYDAATAVGEGAIMAAGITSRSRALVSKAVHPNYRQVLRTYTSGLGMEVEEVACAGGVTDAGSLRDRLDGSVGSVIVQSPNFFGSVEALGEFAETAHSAGALLIVCADPISLGLLNPPGVYGADIVVGEGQALGVPMGFGGPFLGIFACRQEYIWRMPGRIVGATVDADGRRAYTLTLQTREQHIRREKATSNICTNQALVALAASVYLAALGKNGLRRVAELCFQKAHYAQRELSSRAGLERPWAAAFFKEFVVGTKRPVAETNQRLLENGILGGLDLGAHYPELDGHMLLCVTERRTREQIDRLVELLS